MDRLPRRPARPCDRPGGRALLAERVEGNLLAAHQEIEKLALLHAGGTVGADEVLAAVANSARYDVFQLGEAALDGDAARACASSMACGPRAPNRRSCCGRCAASCARSPARAQSGRRRRLRPPGRTPRGAAGSARSRRREGQPLGPLFIDAGRVDRQIKGLGTGDPWTGLTGLVAALAGVGCPSTGRLSPMRPLGVFGGMFDPIHYGHLRTAHELFELLDLEAIAFVPAGDPPHRAPPLADGATRLAMVRAAIEGDARFLVDDRELRRAGPSYTVLTLEELRAERGAQPIALIMGMDAFAGLDSWHRAAELIGLAHIIVAVRPGAQPPRGGLAAALLRDRGCDDARRLAGAPAGLVYVNMGTQLDVSSSAVRDVVAAGRDPRYLMPEAVRRIIIARGSYARPGETEE